MNSAIEEKSKGAAQEFLGKIKQLIEEKSYNELAALFNDDASQATGKCALLPEIQEQLLEEVCIKYLDEATYERSTELYNCADELLKRVARYAPTDDLLIRLLEMCEEFQKDYQFTTVLRALQSFLLNYGDEKSKAYDWAFNTLRCCLQQMQLPAQVVAGYDEAQARLLEQDRIVEEILARYITVGLFYGPLKESVLNQPRSLAIFRDCSIKNRRNLLCCFLVQLLGKPLALLDLTVTDERKTNSYTLQVVRGLARDITQLIIDPCYFLTVVEQQARWQRRLDGSKGVFEMSSNHIFLISERLPLEGLGIYYYMLFSDPSLRKEFNSMPKVYDPGFLFEANLYLVNKLLMQEESAFQLRGVLLAKQILTIFLNQRSIPSVALELEVHKIFCERLCTIIGYAANLQLRRESISVLRQYILLYDHEGRFLILRNVLPGLQHMGLKSYLITLHKDIIASAISSAKSFEEIPFEYKNSKFRDLLLNVICDLPKGAETDLLIYAEPISAALNVIRYYALCDSKNYTGFWDLEKEITQKFLEPLRQGMDYSIAHYKLEAKQVDSNWDDEKMKEKERNAMELINVSIQNKGTENEQTNTLSRESKLQFLQQKLTTFDLLRSLWARTQEVLEQTSKSRR